VSELLPELTKEELKKIRANNSAWANNCGGCETCDQVFGTTPEYDFEENWLLLNTIENREQEITLLKARNEKLEIAIESIKHFAETIYFAPFPMVEGGIDNAKYILDVIKDCEVGNDLQTDKTR